MNANAWMLVAPTLSVRIYPGITPAHVPMAMEAILSME